MRWIRKDLFVHRANVLSSHTLFLCQYALIEIQFKATTINNITLIILIFNALIVFGLTAITRINDMQYSGYIRHEIER
jgi:hypothetical protein